MIEELLLGAAEKMEKAVDVAKEEFGAVRTGRAAPAMFTKVLVEYYGTMTPLPQLASITVPEARMAVVKPYDPSQIAALEKSIRDSDLGVNPTNDGTVIRVVFPQLTEERRREMVKVSRSKGEDAKVSIRNIRRKTVHELDRIQKEGDAGEDEVRRAEKELDDTTGRYIAQIDELMKHKEVELLEV